VTKIEFLQPDFCHQEKIEAIRLASYNRIYTYSFPTLYCWAEEEQYRFSITDGAFLTQNPARGNRAYLAPCGTDEGKKKLVEALLRETSPEFYFLGEQDLDFFNRNFPGSFAFEECPNDASYLFDRSEQLALTGERFKRLRHKVHQSEKQYRWSVEPITPDNIHRAMKINRIWAEGKENMKSDLLAATKGLENLEKLHMWGRLFTADGEDVAYILGSFVTPEIFDTNFSKTTLPDIDAYVRWRFFRELPESVTLLDSEEDMGLAGLREHKLRRVPCGMRKVWKGFLIHE